MGLTSCSLYRGEADRQTDEALADKVTVTEIQGPGEPRPVGWWQAAKVLREWQHRLAVLGRSCQPLGRVDGEAGRPLEAGHPACHKQRRERTGGGLRGWEGLAPWVRYLVLGVGEAGVQDGAGDGLPWGEEELGGQGGELSGRPPESEVGDHWGTQLQRSG